MTGAEGRSLSAELHRLKSKGLLSLVRVARSTLWLCILPVLVSCRPLLRREVSGAVLALEGSAQGMAAGKTIRLTTNEWIQPGEKITTTADTRLDLMLLPGILVELAADTEIEIIRLRLVRDGDETIRPMNAREASLELIRGTLVASVGQAQTRSRIFVQTAAGNLSASNLRTFKVQIDENRARVIAVRGRTTFKPAEAGAPITIEAGYFAEWPPRGIAPPRPAVRSDSIIQAEIGRILRAEGRLFRLQKNYRASSDSWPPLH